MPRKSSAYAARDAMQRRGYDPIEEQIKLAQEEGTPATVRLAIAQALTPYMYPKLSNVEIAADVNATVNNSPDQAAMMARFLSNPELADAAQKLSLVAADLLLEGHVVHGEDE